MLAGVHCDSIRKILVLLENLKLLEALQVGGAAAIWLQEPGDLGLPAGSRLACNTDDGVGALELGVKNQEMDLAALMLLQSDNGKRMILEEFLVSQHDDKLDAAGTAAYWVVADI